MNIFGLLCLSGTLIAEDSQFLSWNGFYIYVWMLSIIQYKYGYSLSSD